MTLLQSQSGIGRPIRILAIGWAITFVLLMLALLVLPILLRVLAVLLFVAATAFAGYSAIELVLAKGRVLRDRDVVAVRGLVRLISWNPTEGVVFLKNKQVDYIDDNPNDGGGIRAIFPLLGEELVLRIPLEIQTLDFEDAQVLTREYMPLTVKGTMYWKVSDLGRFYLNISKEIHSKSDTNKHIVEVSARQAKLEVAEDWLRRMAEEKTRSIVSRIGTGLLISDQLATDVPQSVPGGVPLLASAPQSSPGFRSATDGLANTIKDDFTNDVREYGLEIHRVALQELRLPPEIYAAAVEACKSAYLPLKARAEALERKMKLQAEADVIGAEAVGLKEIAGNIPALAFQEFLAPLFLDFNRKRGLGSVASQEVARTTRLIE